MKSRFRRDRSTPQGSPFSGSQYIVNLYATAFVAVPRRVLHFQEVYFGPPGIGRYVCRSTPQGSPFSGRTNELLIKLLKR